MSVFNKYQNLPGMLIEFKDGGKALRFNDATENTGSLLLLGTAVDGPVMEPIAVDDSTAEALFGSSQKTNGASNGATLVKRFNEAWEAGCRDIRLMRVTGSEAEVTISAPTKTLIEKIRHDEELGLAAGNEATTFDLSQKDIVLDSILVYSKGILVEDKHLDFECVDSLNLTSGGAGVIGHTYDSVKVTIKEDAIDSGSIVSMSYSYKSIDAVADKLVRADAQNEIALNYMPCADSPVSIKSDTGEVLSDSQFHLEGNRVVLNFTPATIDRFTVEYSTEVEKHMTETMDAEGQPLRVKSKKQTFSMSAAPENLDETFLYIDGSLNLNANVFTVEGNRLILDLDYIDKNQTIGISFSKEDVLDDNREIKIKTIFGGAVYNQSRIKVYELLTQDGRNVKVIELIKPESKLALGEQSVIFSTLDFDTFGELVDAINTYSQMFIATTNTPDEDTAELYNCDEFFRKGDDGLKRSKEEMFEALSGKRDTNGYLEEQGAYQLLENYQVDSIVPLGVYMDDVLLKRNHDFAYELALFCAINSYRNKTVLGFIETKPLIDTSLKSVQAHANYLATLNPTYYMLNENGSYVYDSEGNPVDLGRYINVIAGPTPLVNHAVYSMREASAAVMYAASTSVLLPQSSPMNKKIRGTIGLKYSFSNSQLNTIVGNRMVALGLKSAPRGGYLEGAFVIDAPTAARVGSQYGRITTLQIFREVADQIRRAADPFIGEPNSIESRNALSAVISKTLDSLLVMGMFAEYSFNLVSESTGSVDEAKLELAIRPPGELRKINTVMGIK